MVGDFYCYKFRSMHVNKDANRVQARHLVYGALEYLAGHPHHLDRL